MLGQPYMLGALRFPSPASPGSPAAILFRDLWAYPAGDVAAGVNPTAWPVRGYSLGAAGVTLDGAGNVSAAGGAVARLVSRQISYNGDLPNQLTVGASVVTTGSISLQIEAQQQLAPPVYSYAMVLQAGGVTGQQILTFEQGFIVQTTPVPLVNQGVQPFALYAGAWNGVSRQIFALLSGVAIATWTSHIRAPGVNNQGVAIAFGANSNVGGISFTAFTP